MPAGGFCLVPGRAQDAQRLAKASHKYELWHTRLSGPARNRQEEEFYWALLEVVADGIGRTKENLHWDLKVEVGKIVGMVNSEFYGLVPIVKSSRDMDDDEYHAYVAMAKEILFLRYLPKVRRKDVLDRVEEIMRGK